MKRGILTFAAAAALFATTAGSASAMAINGPACNTRVASPAITSASCGFDSPTDWSSIRIDTTGTVTVTTRCTYLGYTRTYTRTVSASTTWISGTSGTCSLTLTASGTTVASGTSTPTIPPIIGPY